MRISDWSSDVCSSDLLAQGTDALGKRLSEGRLAESLLPDEDNKLIELAGYANVANARARYVVLRFGLALALPVGAVLLRRAWLGPGSLMADRKSVVWGKSVSVRVDLGGRRIIKNKKQRIAEQQSKHAK